MIFMTGWAMLINLQNYYASSKWLIFCIGLATIVLEIWMIIESIIILKEVYGAESEALAQKG